MLFFMFLLSYVLVGSFGLSEHCKDRQQETCGESWFKGVPENTSELKEACKNLLEFGKCSLNIAEECSEKEKILYKIRHLISYIEKVCKEENPVFRAFTKNQACIRDAINSGSISSDCKMIDNISEKNKEILSSHRRELVERGTHVNEYNEYCIDVAWIYQCPAISLGIQCGSEVKKSVSEIGREVWRHVVPEEMCDHNTLEEVSASLNKMYETMLIEERYEGKGRSQ